MTSDDTATKPASTSTSKDSAASSDASASYSRGERQKPVTATYKENWNLIFGNKSRTKPVRAKVAETKAAKAKTAKNTKARANASKAGKAKTISKRR